MRQFMKCCLLLSLVALFAIGMAASSAFAGKPTDSMGIYLGNGFPSGPHFNLNIIGKKDNFTCPPPQYEWTITGTTDGHDTSSETGDGHLDGTIVIAESCPAGHTCTQGA